MLRGEDQLEAALLLKPESVEARLVLARALIASSNFNEALQQLGPLAKSQPRNAELFELLAKVYSGLGKIEDAQRAQAKANSIQRKP